MTDLIERLEAATGPDEWCDYHLWLLVVPDHREWYMGNIGGLEGVPLWGDPRKDRHWDKSPPAYTGSIDAALTLATGDRVEECGGAIGILKCAIDMMQHAGANIADLPRFIVIAALKSRGVV